MSPKLKSFLVKAALGFPITALIGAIIKVELTIGDKVDDYFGVKKVENDTEFTEF